MYRLLNSVTNFLCYFLFCLRRANFVRTQNWRKSPLHTILALSCSLHIHVRIRTRSYDIVARFSIVCNVLMDYEVAIKLCVTNFYNFVTELLNLYRKPAGGKKMYQKFLYTQTFPSHIKTGHSKKKNNDTTVKKLFYKILLQNENLLLNYTL